MQVQMIALMIPNSALQSASKIIQAVKSAKELTKHKEVVKNKQKEIANAAKLKPKKDLDEIAKIMDLHKDKMSGDGFHKF